MKVLNSEVIKTPRDITDHFATLVIIEFSYDTYHAYYRRVWNYKNADFRRLNELITDTDWSFLYIDCMDIASTRFSSKFMDLIKLCIPSKNVLVRPRDKPWYDSVIRKTSRQECIFPSAWKHANVMPLFKGNKAAIKLL